MNETERLGEEKISKLIVKYSIPAILSMLITSLYNIADRAFIGSIPEVGPLAIAGLGITMPIFTLIVAFGVLTAMGATTNISIKLGEGKRDEAEKYLGNAFMLAVIISAVVTVVGLAFINPILRVFGASSETLIYAKEYISVIFVGSVFAIAGFTLNNSIRADGNPKMAARTMIAGCIINLILDPLFIFVFGMGIRGAAIATVLTQGITFIWIIYYFTKGKSNLKIKGEYLRLDFKYVKTIVVIGLAPFAMELSASLVHVILNNSLKVYGGDLAIGAMTAVTSIALIFMMPIFGLTQGVQTIIGYNYGAKKYNRSKEALKLSMFIGTIIVTIGFVLVQMFPEVFIGIFNRDPELMRIAVGGIRIYLLTLPLIAVAIVGPVYFQAIGKAKYSMFLSLLRQFILLIPIIIILPKFIGLPGVWVAQPISDIISAIVIGVFLFREFKREK
ncbi:MATE family efflux transporter [Clostridium paraputrificum]|uniref:MATE family efflux transporter n=1 Tax=Clostridium TaxID=1485 RepID=UPI003D355D89